MGGRVRQFRVSRAGGYVVTDTNNFWISLAPYFFPIYSILALLFYGGIGVFVDVEPYRRWLFGVVGFTWSFHVTFSYFGKELLQGAMEFSDWLLQLAHLKL